MLIAQNTYRALATCMLAKTKKPVSPTLSDLHLLLISVHLFDCEGKVVGLQSTC